MGDSVKNRKMESNLKFDDTYVEAAFVIWYANGRPPMQQLVDLLDKDRHGRVPALQVLAQWRDKRDWITRAELLDIGVTHQIEKQAIQEKVEMLNRHAEAGKKMTDKAIDYIEKHDIMKTSDAIKMLVQGVQIERTSRGLPLALDKLSEMADETVLNRINALTTKMNPDDALKYLGDGEILPEEPEETEEEEA